MITARHSPDLLAQFHSLRSQLHDLLFPPQCVGCDAVGDFLCARCAQQVQAVGDSICRRCGRAQRQLTATCNHCVDEDAFVLTMTRAAAFHRSPLREAIHAFKYEDRTELAALLGRYLTAAFDAPCWRLAQPVDLVVPVPLHADRLKERGFNQAELLAAAFCRRSGLAMAPDCVQRVRHTPHQVGLNAVERRQNVAAAFEALPTVGDKSLLLIDDVYTTGATLNACASAALDAGAARVYALTLAIPGPDGS